MGRTKVAACYTNRPGRNPQVRTLELRRHAERDPTADRLSPQGRAQAQALGAELAGAYAVVFISPAQRAAETVAWLLRGLGEQLPAHAVIPGLAAKDNDGSPLAMAGVVAALLDAVPKDARGLAVSHTPLIERAVLGLSAREIEPLGECEGVLLTKEHDEAPVEVTELRLS
jgi:phosphohistidine phosphatase SixA